MIKRNSKWDGCFTVFVGLLLCAMVQVHAQQRGTAGGGRTAGQGRSGSTGSGSREYYGNGEVGDAMITVDPDTRRLVIITDEETSQYISQVVSNLDRPKPQVLIKVVFLEVTRNDSLDIGIEGTFGKDIGNNGITSAYLTNFAAIPTTTSSGFGSNFNSGFSIFPTNLTPLTRGVSAINSFGLASSGGPAGLYQIFSQDYTATIRAIATAGKAKV